MCEWCDWNCNWGDNIQNNIIYYFNSPSEHKLICGDYGEKVKTNNEDDDIIFCYRAILMTSHPIIKVFHITILKIP